MKRSTRIILIVVVLAVTIFAATLVRALWYAPEQNDFAPATTIDQRIVPPDEMPARLIIPKLGIDTNIQYVGLTADGNMGVPNNFTDVAWYKYGAVPGERGSAAIAGHLDNGLSLAGVFKRLSELAPGDDVYVERKNGEHIYFKVTEVELYNYKEVPLERLFERKDGMYLNLITCDGSWIRNERTYDQRLVVYTRLVR